MKKTGLTWAEVEKRAGDKAVVVMYDGIEKSGYCREEHMRKQFDGCELMQLNEHTFQVVRWAPEKTQLLNWKKSRGAT